MRRRSDRWHGRHCCDLGAAGWPGCATAGNSAALVRSHNSSNGASAETTFRPRLVNTVADDAGRGPLSSQNPSFARRQLPHHWRPPRWSWTMIVNGPPRREGGGDPFLQAVGHPTSRWATSGLMACRRQATARFEGGQQCVTWAPSVRRRPVLEAAEERGLIQRSTRSGEAGVCGPGSVTRAAVSTAVVGNRLETSGAEALRAERRTGVSWPPSPARQADIIF